MDGLAWEKIEGIEILLEGLVKRWGEFLNPWGRTVLVSRWVMGSVHVKANKGWEEGCKGTVKKVSLRSRTENKEVWGGIWERRV
jgi:hypothetical protein